MVVVVNQEVLSTYLFPSHPCSRLSRLTPYPRSYVQCARSGRCRLGLYQSLVSFTPFVPMCLLRFVELISVKIVIFVISGVGASVTRAVCAKQKRPSPSTRGSRTKSRVLSSCGALPTSRPLFYPGMCVLRAPRVISPITDVFTSSLPFISDKCMQAFSILDAGNAPERTDN
jgi:hypothetical protein